jgi:uncharacterized protein YybS (DUF2232 family)
MNTEKFIKPQKTGMEPKQIKDILTGVFLYLLLVGVMYIVPISGIITWLFFPLPVLFFRLKTGRRNGMIIMLASLVLFMIITMDIAVTIIYFGSLLITGFVLGECIEKNLSVEKIILYPFLFAFGCWMAVILFYLGISDHGAGQFLSEYIEGYKALIAQFINELLVIYPEMNLDQKALARRVIAVFTIAPGIFLISYIMMIYMNLIIIKRILLKKGIVISTIENLNLWKSPEFLVYGLILVSVLSFFASGVIRGVAVNLIVILLMIYCFQGIAVVSFFFQKKKVSPVFRFILYLLIVMMPHILLLVVGCGLFDNWFNFRKLNITES